MISKKYRLHRSGGRGTVLQMGRVTQDIWMGRIAVSLAKRSMYSRMISVTIYSLPKIILFLLAYSLANLVENEHTKPSCIRENTHKTSVVYKSVSNFTNEVFIQIVIVSHALP